jgi:hypothetical protein
VSILLSLAYGTTSTEFLTAQLLLAPTFLFLGKLSSTLSINSFSSEVNQSQCPEL